MGSYDLSENVHDYRGIYYSQREAETIAGGNSHVVKYLVPYTDGDRLNDKHNKQTSDTLNLV